MPQDDDARNGSLDRLEDRIDAFEAKRNRAMSPVQAGAMGDAYRFVANLIGGVLGGIGLGWLVDHFAGTAPWGLIGGLLIGTTVSIVSVVRTAGRMSKQALKDNPPQAVPFDDEDED